MKLRAGGKARARADARSGARADPDGFEKLQRLPATAAFGGGPAGGAAKPGDQGHVALMAVEADHVLDHQAPWRWWHDTELGDLAPAGLSDHRCAPREVGPNQDPKRLAAGLHKRLLYLVGDHPDRGAAAEGGQQFHHHDAVLLAEVVEHPQFEDAHGWDLG